MKKLITALLLVLAVSATWAQSDSTDIPDTAIDTANSAAIDLFNDEEYTFSKPNRNPIYYFDSPFCDHFLEIKFLAGRDFGVGLTYSYLPEVLGFNVGSLYSGDDLWINAGVDWRASKPWAQSDWQLFANGGIKMPLDDQSKIRPTVELGVRWASDARLGRFCFSSGSLGLMTDFNNVYFTLGVGLSISILTTAFVALAL